MRTAPARIAIALVASTALVAACGDDDDGSLFGNDDDGSLFGDDETASDDDTETGDTGADEPDDFCTLLADIDAMDMLDEPFVDPPALESAFTAFSGMASAALDQAPDEIADDIAIVVDGLQRFQEGLADADYNILDVEISVFLDVGNDPEIDAASDRLDEYGEEQCGLPPSDSEPFDDSAFDDLPEGAITMRDALIAGLIDEAGLDEDSARCIGEAMEPSDIADDGSRMTGLFEGCGIDPQTGQPLDD